MGGYTCWKTQLCKPITRLIKIFCCVRGNILRSEVLAWNLSGIAAKLQTEGPDYVYLKAFLQELADRWIKFFSFPSEKRPHRIAYKPHPEDFAYKVFEYLWADVAKFNRQDWFDSKIQSLDMLIKAYLSHMNIFSSDLYLLSIFSLHFA